MEFLIVLGMKNGLQQATFIAGKSDHTYSTDYLLLKQIFIEYLLYSKYCIKCQSYKDE